VRELLQSKQVYDQPGEYRTERFLKIGGSAFGVIDKEEMHGT
jgi:hypothetical protein